LTDEQRVYLNLTGPVELLSLTGNISRRDDGAIHIHAHVVVSTGSEQAAMCYGGHLVEGAVIFSTGEIALAELTGMDLRRSWDDETKTLELYPAVKK
jgi:predicted DNA-binding protein with PD1-like motif